VAMESQAAGMSASLTLPWFARTLPICLDEVDYDYNAVQNQHPKNGFNLDLSLSLVWKNVQFQLKLRFFKNLELYWSNLPQNSNLGREGFVQKSGVRIPVGEGRISSLHLSLLMFNL
jgi:hypothetical protein